MFRWEPQLVEREGVHFATKELEGGGAEWGVPLTRLTPQQVVTESQKEQHSELDKSSPQSY